MRNKKLFFYNLTKNIQNPRLVNVDARHIKNKQETEKVIYFVSMETKTKEEI